MKHTPATPLPWQQAYPQTDAILGTDERGEFRVAQCGATEGAGGDLNREGMDLNAAYIAHAANAYPASTGKLKELALAMDDFEIVDVARVRRLIKETRALLRELGEAE